MNAAGHPTAGLAHLRILVIMPSIPVQGMERGNLQVMKLLIERGADVLFVTHQTYGARVQDEVQDIGARYTTARVDALLLHLPRSTGEACRLVRAWARGAWDFDRAYRAYKPTHIFVTDLLYVLYALPLLVRARTPSIFYLPVPPDLTLQGIRGRIVQLMWKQVVARMITLLVANSDFTLRQMTLAGVPTARSTRIYHSLPERGSSQPSDEPVLDRRKLNIVFLGRVTREKGVRELVDAAYEIVRARTDVDFYIAGEKDWLNPFAAGLTAEVESRELAGRIHFIGEIRGVMGLLRQASLHVCPTMIEEPFGLVVLEAKSVGVPSVVFPSGGLPELVRHLEDGYVCREKSAAALIEGLRYFIEHPSLRLAAGGAARASLARFGRDVIGDQWASALLQCERRNSPRKSRAWLRKKHAGADRDGHAGGRTGI